MSAKKGTTRMRSPIWNMFTIDPLDFCKAICAICQTSVRRGGIRADAMCTTNLWNHVRHKHPDVCKKLESKSKRALPKGKSSKKCNKKRDPFTLEILNLYEVPGDNKTKAKCLECQKLVFCGAGCSNPNSLIGHTKLQHPGSYWTAVKQTRSVRITGLRTRKKNTPKSRIWDSFDEDPTNPCQAICRTCNTVVKRGSSAVHLNTTNLHRHLGSAFHMHVVKVNKEQCADDSNEELVQNINSEIVAIDDLSGDNEDDDPSPPLRKIERTMADTQIPSEMVNSSQNGSSLEPQGMTSDVSKILNLGETNVMHTALVMKALFEQQKKDCNSDFSLLLSLDSDIYHTQTSSTVIFDNDGNLKYYVHENKYEFKLHSCVLSVLSDKLNKLIQTGTRTYVFENVHKDAMQFFIEIVYTGKLRGVWSVKKSLLKDVYNIAKALSCPLIMDYLKQEFPKFSFEGESTYVGIDRVNLQSEYTSAAENNSSDTCDNNALNPVKNQNSSKFESKEKSHPVRSRVNKRKNYHPKFSNSHEEQKQSDENGESSENTYKTFASKNMTCSETKITELDSEMIFTMFPDLIGKNQEDTVVEIRENS